MKLLLLMKSFCVIGCLCLCLSFSVVAQEKHNVAKLSKQQAIKIAKQRVHGKVIKVSRKQSHYRVKLLTPKGRVVSINVDDKPRRKQ